MHGGIPTSGRTVGSTTKIPRLRIEHTTSTDQAVTSATRTRTGGFIDCEQLVCRDIMQRQQKGIEKYGTTVAANPLSMKQWLQHAYEECLDQAIYLKRAITEMETQ